MPAPFNRQGIQGPRGLLGIPPRRFRERTLPTETQARFYQANAEVWTKQTDPEARFYQANLEVWTLSDDQLRRLVNVYFL